MPTVDCSLTTGKALNKFKGACPGENLLLKSIKSRIEEEEAEEEDLGFDVAVPVSELRGVLHNLGGNLTKEEIDALVKMNDIDGKQIMMIDNVQFMRILMFASLMTSVFDRQGNGTISARDLANVLTNFTDKFSFFNIYSLVRSEERKPGIELNYEDFSNLVKTTR